MTQHQTALVRERPILFSAPMVRGLLDGRKTQTRRIVKGEALDWLDDAGFTPDFVADPFNRLCPYGVPGDHLWVRETLRRTPSGWIYSADESALLFNGRRERHAWSHEKAGNTCVSIHMPRWASRITLRITDVRVERLNDISAEDAIAEGLSSAPGGWWSGYEGAAAADPVSAYAMLWERINGPGSWAANPWVWAVSFEMTAPPPQSSDGESR